MATPVGAAHASPMLAPASRTVVRKARRPPPAPRSTTTVEAGAGQPLNVSGTSATRRSPAAVSRRDPDLHAARTLREWRDRLAPEGNGRCVPGITSEDAHGPLRQSNLATPLRAVMRRASRHRGGVAAGSAGTSERIDDPADRGTLHDVGKLVGADTVLGKPGPLSEAEFDQIRVASRRRGARWWPRSRRARRCRPARPPPPRALGRTGYPQGCAGEEIPIEARLLAVADAYDAMTSDRPYRRAVPLRARSPSSSGAPARSSTRRCRASSPRPGRQGGFELPTGIPRAAAS